MDSKTIIENLLNGDAYSAKDAISNILYCKTAESLRDYTPESASKGFKPENAVGIEEKEMSPEQKAYRELFDKILGEFGVDNVNDLPDDKKDDFFNKVESEWDNHPDNDSEGEGEELDEVGYMGSRPRMGGNLRTGMTRAKQLELEKRKRERAKANVQRLKKG